MKTWEERFDKVYVDTYGRYDDIKSFIASELQKQKEEIVEMIKSEIEWEDPDIKGNKETDYRLDPVMTPWLKNIVRNDIIKKIGEHE